jgi:hypothetical protein
MGTEFQFRNCPVILGAVYRVPRPMGPIRWNLGYFAYK